MGRSVEVLEQGWVVAQPEYVVASNFSRDFDSSLFNAFTPLSEIEYKVASYMGEKLFMPRYEEIRFGYDGSLDPEYLAVMQRSIDHWRQRGDERTAYRFEMELLGMQRLAKLVSRQVALDRNDPARHIIGSDPGDTYSTAEGSKTVIFVGEVKSLNDSEIIYGQTAVPLELLELLVLYEKIISVGKVDHKLEQAEVTPEILVSYPVALLGTLNLVAEVFGQESWEQIAAKAADQLRLENDIYGLERRQELIRHYSKLIFDALHEGRDREYLNTIDESMRRVFALEAGADEMLGLHADMVEEVVRRNLVDVKAEQLGIFSKKLNKTQIEWFEKHYQVSMSEIMEYRGWMTTVFRENSLARRALMTGCGGGVVLDLSSSPWGGAENFMGGYGYETTSYAGYDMVGDFGYQETTTEAEILHEGESTCYPCPVCESEGHKPGGEVKLKSGNLVCQRKPEEHYIKYESQTS